MKAKIKKDWYGREKSIEELHHESIQWKSEISFIDDEMRFLEHLLSSKYIDFLEVGLYKKIETFIHEIATEKKIGKTIYKLIEEHEIVLSDLIDNESVTSNKNFLETHKNLNNEVNNYFYDYKEIKQNIFNIVENVMREKKKKKLLN